MRESEFQTIFGKWVRANRERCAELFGPCAAFELKLFRGTSLPLTELKDHQRANLLAVEGEGVYHKIADNPWIKDRPFSQAPKPFDCFSMARARGWVVIMRYRPGQLRKFRETAFIRIKDWPLLAQAVENAGRKSATWEMIFYAATKIVQLEEA
jgi:hypothetical protein